MHVPLTDSHDSPMTVRAPKAPMRISCTSPCSPNNSAMRQTGDMTMVHSIQNSLPLSPAEGELQMIASQVKFHASYFAVFLFAFGFLQFGWLGRVIAVLLWLYIPCGVLISVVPVESARLLVLGRTIFFVFAFVLSAILFFSRPKASTQPAH